MRNSRKYINPSINANRNIFISRDLTPSAFILFPSDISGFSTASTSFTINNINSPVLIGYITSTNTNSHTLEFFKNSRLINSYTISSRVSTIRVLSEYFENGDTLTITASGALQASYNLTVSSLSLTILNFVVENISSTITVNLN